MWLESDGFLSFWNVNLYQLPIVWISKLLIAVCYLLIHSQAYGKLIVILHMSNFKSNDIFKIILLNSQFWYLFLLKLCEI